MIKKMTVFWLMAVFLNASEEPVLEESFKKELTRNSMRDYFDQLTDRLIHPELFAQQDVQSLSCGQQSSQDLLSVDEFSSLTRAISTPPYTGLLNGFGRAIGIPSNPSLLTPLDNTFLIVGGYAYEVNKDANNSISTVQGTQTSYASPTIGRFNYLTGVLDSTFGTQGLVLTQFTSSAYALRLVIQPAPLGGGPSSQKIIIVGYTFQITDNLLNNNPYRYQLFVARYNWDGSLDTTFNPQGANPGITLLSLPNFSAVALNPNASVIANAAYPNSVITSQQVSSTAYLPSQGYALVLDENNNVIVVGNANGMLLVARYLGTTTTVDGVTAYAGTLDTTFNPNGYLYDLGKPISLNTTTTNPSTAAIFDFGTKSFLKGQAGVFMASILGAPTFSNFGLGIAGNDGGFAVDIDSNGNIVVAGFGYQVLPGSQNGATKAEVVRITPAGAPDFTFGPYRNGTIITSLFTNDTRAYSVVINKIPNDPNNGKIIISGAVKDAFFSSYVMVARYKSNGYPDGTFGPGTVDGKPDLKAKGVIFFPIQTVSSPVNTMLTDPGFSFTNVKPNPSGINVTLGIDFPSVYALSTAVRLQNDGKIVLSGYTVISAGAELVGLSNTATAAITTQNTGSSIVQGTFKTVCAITSFLSARINSTGYLDTTFNNAGNQKGTVIIPLRGSVSYDDEAFDLAIQPTVSNPKIDGKIVLVGQSKNNSFFYSTDPTAQLYSFAAARLNKNGTLDTTISAVITNK